MSKAETESNVTTEMESVKRTTKDKEWLDTQNIPNSTDIGFIDTHCHLDRLFERLNYKGTHTEFRSLHQDSYPANYEGCVAVFCDPFSFMQTEMLEKYLDDDGVWAAFGCHPKNAKYYSDDIEQDLMAALLHPKVRALGEIGLDYSRGNTSPKVTQHEVMRRQLFIATERGLPLVIHCRDATQDRMEIMKEILSRDHTIHLHCFTEGWGIARRWLEEFPNLFIGLINLLTFSDARDADVHEVARRIPLGRLLLETDAPYFVPRMASRGGKFSHPGMAIHVARKIATLRETPLAEVLYWTRKNTHTMYGI